MIEYEDKGRVPVNSDIVKIEIENWGVKSLLISLLLKCWKS